LDQGVSRDAAGKEITVTVQELAYYISEWRKRNGFWGNPARDYGCAEYIEKVEGIRPRSKLEWEELFEYHYG
jgi:hypothetical protein